MANHIAHHPWTAVRCPHSGETLFVRESKDADERWKWLHRGRHYDQLDDILDARLRKIRKEVDYSQ